MKMRLVVLWFCDGQSLWLITPQALDNYGRTAVARAPSLGMTKQHAVPVPQALLGPHNTTTEQLCEDYFFIQIAVHLDD
jgi:hypothetical protein